MIAAITIIIFLVLPLIVVNLSLSFRHAYLRQKCLNRMDDNEIKIMNETDLDFWSFLK